MELEDFQPAWGGRLYLTVCELILFYNEMKRFYYKTIRIPAMTWDDFLQKDISSFSYKNGFRPSSIMYRVAKILLKNNWNPREYLKAQFDEMQEKKTKHKKIKMWTNQLDSDWCQWVYKKRKRECPETFKDPSTFYEYFQELESLDKQVRYFIQILPQVENENDVFKHPFCLSLFPKYLLRKNRIYNRLKNEGYYIHEFGANPI